MHARLRGSNNHEETISSFIAGSNIIMVTPNNIYVTDSWNIVLNIFEYFKDEEMKFPLNHLTEDI